MDPQLDQMDRYLEEQEEEEEGFLLRWLDIGNRMHYYQETFDVRAWTAPGPWRPGDDTPYHKYF
ncbi:hypothetical protein KKF45_05705 [Patescibacteria group bacterium]|nr:hypothetical protein [Patescibacteria group bacterium]